MGPQKRNCLKGPEFIMALNWLRANWQFAETASTSNLAANASQALGIRITKYNAKYLRDILKN